MRNKKGKLRLSSIDKREACKSEMLDKIFKSNYYGDVLVLEYVNNRKIKIRFLDCGSEQIVQKYFLERGMVTPNGNGRIKVYDQQSFVEQLRLNNKNFSQLSGYQGSSKNVKICCNVCGTDKCIRPSAAIKPLRCLTCDPINITPTVKTYQQFLEDFIIPPDWSILCDVWDGVLKSKLKLTHSCSHTHDIKATSLKAFRWKCKACSDVLEQQRKNEIVVNSKLRVTERNRSSLEDILRKAKTLHNDEFIYNLTALESHDFMFKAINKPIEITHKPCGSVLNKSLSYHVQGGPDKRPVGCPVCASFGYSYANGSYFYIVTSNDGMFKVGITKNPEQRVAQMNRNKDRVWTKHWQIKLEGDLRPLEKEVLGVLSVMYSKPVCIFDGSTESFIVNNDTVPLSFIKHICSTYQK